jgi:hypothetical protein
MMYKIVMEQAFMHFPHPCSRAPEWAKNETLIFNANTYGIQWVSCFITLVKIDGDAGRSRTGQKATCFIMLEIDDRFSSWGHNSGHEDRLDKWQDKAGKQGG